MAGTAFDFLSVRAFQRLDPHAQEAYLLTLTAHLEAATATLGATPDPATKLEPPTRLFPPHFALLTPEQKFAYCSQLVAYLKAARRLPDN
jgi:hypothetical protein